MTEIVSVLETSALLLKELKRRNREYKKSDARRRIETRFGMNMRNLRKERHMTQEKLAALCHWHQHYISEIEHGKRNISLRAMETIARALEVSEKDLF